MTEQKRKIKVKNARLAQLLCIYNLDSAAFYKKMQEPSIELLFVKRGNQRNAQVAAKFSDQYENVLEALQGCF